MAKEKFKVLIVATLAAGIAAIAKAISENPEGAAADILIMVEDAKSLGTALSTKESELKVAEAANEELSLELEKSQKRAAQVPDNYTTHTFEYGDDTYGFQFPEMKHKGKVVTSKDVMDSAALQKELIDMGSGMIIHK